MLGLTIFRMISTAQQAVARSMCSVRQVFCVDIHFKASWRYGIRTAWHPQHAQSASESLTILENHIDVPVQLAHAIS